MPSIFSASNKTLYAEASGCNLKPDPPKPREPAFSAPRDFEEFMATLSAIHFWLDNWLSTFDTWAKNPARPYYYYTQITQAVSDDGRDVSIALGHLAEAVDGTTFRHFIDTLAKIHQYLIRNPVTSEDASNGYQAVISLTGCRVTVVAVYVDVFGSYPSRRLTQAAALDRNNNM